MTANRTTSLRRLRWLAIAIVVVLAAGLGYSMLLDTLISAGPGYDRYLRLQHSAQRQVRLHVDGDLLRLDGRFRGTVSAADPIRELRFVLNSSLVVDEVLIDSQVMDPAEPWTNQFLSRPLSARHYVWNGEDSLVAPGETAAVEIRFHGSARSLGLDLPGRSLPLLFSGEALFVPLLSMAPAPLDVEVILPEGWELLADAEFKVEAGREGLRHFKTSGWQGSDPLLCPALVLGPLSLSVYEHSGCRWSVATRPFRRVVEKGLGEALDFVQHRLAVSWPERQTLVLTETPEFGPPRRIGQTLWMASYPRDGRLLELVRCLGVLALRSHDITGGPLEGLPEVMALETLPLSDVSERAMERDRFCRQAPPKSALPGWLALGLIDGFKMPWPEIEAWLEKPKVGGARSPFVLADETAREVFQWATQPRPVSVRWGAIDRRSGHIQVRVDPPPPSSLLDPTLPLLQIGGEGPENAFGEPVSVRLRRGVASVPFSSAGTRRLIADPYRLWPDTNRLDNEISLELEPSAFAVAPSTESVSLALTRDHREHTSLYFFDLREEGRDLLVDPFEVMGEARRLQWVSSSRYLFLQIAGERQLRGRLLDLESGRLRPFSGSDEIQPGRSAVLRNSRQADGRYRHSLYWLNTRRTEPFGNAFEGPLTWVAGQDELLARAPDGEAVVVDVYGRVRQRLSHLIDEVRLVKRTVLGYTFLTESAAGTRLNLVMSPTESRRLFEVSAGRIQDYFLSETTGRFYVYVDREDGVYLVYAVGSQPGAKPTELYNKPGGQPLTNLHTIKGVVIAEASDDPRVARSLDFFSFASADRFEGPNKENGRLAEGVFLDPAPFLSSAGRYLYYVRADAEPAEVSPAYRRRGLYRYDFLTQRELPIFPIRG